MASYHHNLITIKESLTSLERFIRLDSRNAHRDINIICEKHLKFILSVLYKSEFKLTGEIDLRYPAIDLTNDKMLLAIQVTSEVTNKKIKETLLKYIKNEFHLKYDRIIILFLSIDNKPTITAKQVYQYVKRNLSGSLNSFQESYFDPQKDCLNLVDLNELIYNKCNSEQTEVIANELDIAISQYTLQPIIEYDRFNDLNLKSLNSELKDVSVSESVKKIFETFYPIITIPKDILLSLIPFQDDSRAYYKNYTLYTDNKEFIDFIESIDVSQQNTTESDVVEFLGNQNIFFIGDANRPNLISRIPTFTSEKCDCEKCLFKSLKIDDSLNKAVKPLRFSIKNLHFQFRKAVSLMKLGRIEDSFKLLKKICNYSRRKESHISEFLSVYNLKKLHRYSRYIRNDKLWDTINNYIESINPEKVISEVRNKVLYSEVFECLNYIHREKFVSESIFDSVELLNNSSQLYIGDQYGNLKPNSMFRELLNNIVDSFLFIDRNQLLCLESYNTRKSIELSFESIISFNELQLPSYNTDFTVDNYYLHLWILFSDPEYLLNALEKFMVKTLKYKNQSNHLSSFCDLVKNLSNSIDTLNTEIKNQQDGEVDFQLSKNVNRYISNISILLLVLKLSKDDFNIALSKLLKAFQDFDFLEYKTVSYFNILVNHKVDSINDETAILLWKFENDRINPEFLSRLNLNVLLERNSLMKFRKEYVKSQLNYYSQPAVIQNERIPNYRLLNIYKFCNGGQKLKVKSLIRKKLNIHFNHVTFAHGVLQNILELSEFEEKFISILENEVAEDNTVFSQNNLKYQKSSRLNSFIELAYKSKTNLSKSKYLKLVPDNLYYKWLFNIDDFDYSKFNPYWVLEYESLEYYKKFKTNPKIVKIIKEYLLERPNRLLQKIYLLHLT